MMYNLTDRCKRIRDDVVNKKSLSPKICAQRDFWFRYGQAELAKTNPDASCELAIAAGIAAIIENSAVVIGDDDLIVGYNYGDGQFERPAWPKTMWEREALELNGFSEEQINWYLDENVKLATGQLMPPPDDYSEKQRLLIGEETALNSLGAWSIFSDHTVIGYEKLLRLGFEGLLDEVGEYERKNGGSDFYTAVRMVCDAGKQFGDRWANEAERLGKTEIAKVCRRVPRYGAKSFREAVQSLWFIHIINTWEDSINANSLGRLDQILYPYYRHDIDAGIIDDQQAFELICCLWLKLYRDYDVQQCCVGGTAPDKSSCVNELSWMMLEATEQLDFIRCMSVRFGKATEPEFLQKALRVVGHVGKGVPFFFNDEVMIPALTGAGIKYEDACNYTQLGCVETVIPGKANPHAVNSRCNLLKALEYTLHRGHSGMDKQIMPGIDTGDPLAFDTYDALCSAVKAQIAYLISETVDIAVKSIPATNHNFPRPVKSLLTDGCLDKGRDFNDEGAEYDYYQLCLVGIPNLADSLAAIKLLVYDKKLYTLKELLDALDSNWQNEAMRMDFLNKAPKYGNDLPEVDDIAAEVVNYACDCIEADSKRVGHTFFAQPFTFVWMISHGMKSAASPDGRRDGEILAYSTSPMQGRDKEGLTALLNSIARLPQHRTPGTTSAIVEVDPKLFCDENLPALTDMLIAAGELGLGNVQFNTVSAETLIDAQKHPENYQNLAVRVSGFSQKFNLLGRDLQDHIIARTKHTGM